MLKLMAQFKISGMLSLVMLLTSACASKEDIKTKQSNIYFAAGTQSLMSEQYTDALKSLLKANELTPDRSEILNNLGMAYYFKNEKDLAIKTLQRALKLDGNNSDASVNLASIYYREGKYNEAEKLYKKVLQDLTYDKQARTYYNLGILNLQVNKDVNSAESYFKKSIKEDENYCPSYYQIGMIQYQRRQFNTALRNFKEATLGTCFESPSPHYYQALTLIELKRYGEARLKLDEIDMRFKRSVFAVKARNKVIELNEIENKSKSEESHASRMMLESPDF